VVIIFIVLDSKNILVVEDDLDIRELISFNLANEGHQVFEANDGEVGIDKARNNNPDLILLDLMLPAIQGLKKVPLSDTVSCIIKEHHHLLLLFHHLVWL